ncbi:DinB family protein [Flavobacterium sp. CBA20B-1]|uniref:DinB family protein n=1 Tax=unclassified Flavobacterium TaxID=196869 RepID=UPI0022250E1F|nr:MULTISPECIES: DinB family protein [unclassified Flavobacterium]WCM43414.1 DinB family protein [Flavobacterium sp. CBA20B-1]
MKTSTENLLHELINLMHEHLAFAENLLLVTDAELNKRLTNESWSVLECLEHLNLYGNFYLPEIKNRIETSTTKATAEFKSGWLGNYFAQSMLPKDKLNKMKAFKSMNPIHSSLSKNTVTVFIDQQKQLLDLLNASRTVNLNKVKTSISITTLIKLKLGDTFRFVIYHNKRHVVQAKKVLAN